MRLLAGVNWTRYSTRTYIISSGDSLSEAKALELEKCIGSGSVRLLCPLVDCPLIGRPTQFSVLRIPRARRVLQSYLTSPFSTLYSLAYCLWHISFVPLVRSQRRVFADAILLNGPGSCVPIAFSAFLPRVSFQSCVQGGRILTRRTSADLGSPLGETHLHRVARAHAQAVRLGQARPARRGPFLRPVGVVEGRSPAAQGRSRG